MCIFRREKHEKDLEHSSQLYGFSSVCVHMWLFKLPFKENNFEQTLHSKGFSPVCILMCLFKSVGFTNDLEHSVQLWGFFLLWIFMGITTSIPTGPEHWLASFWAFLNKAQWDSVYPWFYICLYTYIHGWLTLPRVYQQYFPIDQSAVRFQEILHVPLYQNVHQL
jgi:hypothetical protein